MQAIVEEYSALPVDDAESPAFQGFIDAIVKHSRDDLSVEEKELLIQSVQQWLYEQRFAYIESKMSNIPMKNGYYLFPDDQ